MESSTQKHLLMGRSPGLSFQAKQLGRFPSIFTRKLSSSFFFFCLTLVLLFNGKDLQHHNFPAIQLASAESSKKHGSIVSWLQGTSETPEKWLKMNSQGAPLRRTQEKLFTIFPQRDSKEKEDRSAPLFPFTGKYRKDLVIDENTQRFLGDMLRQSCTSVADEHYGGYSATPEYPTDQDEEAGPNCSILQGIRICTDTLSGIWMEAGGDPPPDFLGELKGVTIPACEGLRSTPTRRLLSQPDDLLETTSMPEKIVETNFDNFVHLVDRVLPRPPQNFSSSQLNSLKGLIDSLGRAYFIEKKILDYATSKHLYEGTKEAAIRSNFPRKVVDAYFIAYDLVAQISENANHEEVILCPPGKLVSYLPKFELEERLVAEKSHKVISAGSVVRDRADNNYKPPEGYHCVKISDKETSEDAEKVVVTDLHYWLSWPQSTSAIPYIQEKRATFLELMNESDSIIALHDELYTFFALHTPLWSWIDNLFEMTGIPDSFISGRMMGVGTPPYRLPSLLSLRQFQNPLTVSFKGFSSHDYLERMMLTAVDDSVREEFSRRIDELGSLKGINMMLLESELLHLVDLVSRLSIEWSPPDVSTEARLAHMRRLTNQDGLPESWAKDVEKEEYDKSAFSKTAAGKEDEDAPAHKEETEIKVTKTFIYSREKIVRNESSDEDDEDKDEGESPIEVIVAFSNKLSRWKFSREVFIASRIVRDILKIEASPEYKRLITQVLQNKFLERILIETMADSDMRNNAALLLVEPDVDFEDQIEEFFEANNLQNLIDTFEGLLGFKGLEYVIEIAGYEGMFETLAANKKGTQWVLREVLKANTVHEWLETHWKDFLSSELYEATIGFLDYLKGLSQQHDKSIGNYALGKFDVWQFMIGGYHIGEDGEIETTLRRAEKVEIDEEKTEETAEEAHPTHRRLQFASKYEEITPDSDNELFEYDVLTESALPEFQSHAEYEEYTRNKFQESIKSAEDEQGPTDVSTAETAAENPLEESARNLSLEEKQVAHQVGTAKEGEHFGKAAGDETDKDKVEGFSLQSAGHNGLPTASYQPTSDSPAATPQVTSSSFYPPSISGQYDDFHLDVYTPPQMPGRIPTEKMPAWDYPYGGAFISPYRPYVPQPYCDYELCETDPTSASQHNLKEEEQEKATPLEEEEHYQFHPMSHQSLIPPTWTSPGGSTNSPYVPPSQNYSPSSNGAQYTWQNTAEEVKPSGKNEVSPGSHPIPMQNNWGELQPQPQGSPYSASIGSSGSAGFALPSHTQSGQYVRPYPPPYPGVYSQPTEEWSPPGFTQHVQPSYYNPYYYPAALHGPVQTPRPPPGALYMPRPMAESPFLPNPMQTGMQFPNSWFCGNGNNCGPILPGTFQGYSSSSGKGDKQGSGLLGLDLIDFGIFNKEEKGFLSKI